MEPAPECIQDLAMLNSSTAEQHHSPRNPESSEYQPQLANPNINSTTTEILSSEAKWNRCWPIIDKMYIRQKLKPKQIRQIMMETHQLEASTMKYSRAFDRKKTIGVDGKKLFEICDLDIKREKQGKKSQYAYYFMHVPKHRVEEGKEIIRGGCSRAGPSSMASNRSFATTDITGLECWTIGTESISDPLLVDARPKPDNLVHHHDVVGNLPSSMEQPSSDIHSLYSPDVANYAFGLMESDIFPGAFSTSNAQDANYLLNYDPTLMEMPDPPFEMDASQRPFGEESSSGASNPPPPMPWDWFPDWDDEGILRNLGRPEPSAMYVWYE